MLTVAISAVGTSPPPDSETSHRQYTRQRSYFTDTPVLQRFVKHHKSKSGMLRAEPLIMYKNLLVFTDFSEPANRALDFAARLKKTDEKKVRVAHIIEDVVMNELSHVLPGALPEVKKKIEAETRQRLEKLAEEHSIKATTHVATGTLIEAAKTLVASLVPDLIITGDRGHTSSWGLGTFAKNVVAHLQTDVLVAHGDPAVSFDSVAICVDLSDACRSVVRHGVELARSLDLPLRILHAYRALWHRPDYGMLLPSSAVDFQVQFEASIKGRIESYVQETAGTHTPFEIVLLNGPSYGTSLLGYGKEHPKTLMVLGKKGASNLRYVFLGSTAERVLRSTSCSVLVISSGTNT